MTAGVIVCRYDEDNQTAWDLHRGVRRNAGCGSRLWRGDLVSPYFVPTAAGVEEFPRMAQRGVRIRVLVNSLAATDVRIHSNARCSVVRRRSVKPVQHRSLAERTTELKLNLSAAIVDVTESDQERSDRRASRDRAGET